MPIGMNQDRTRYSNLNSNPTAYVSAPKQPSHQYVDLSKRKTFDNTYYQQCQKNYEIYDSRLAGKVNRNNSSNSSSSQISSNCSSASCSASNSCNVIQKLHEDPYSKLYVNSNARNYGNKGLMKCENGFNINNSNNNKNNNENRLQVKRRQSHRDFIDSSNANNATNAGAYLIGDLGDHMKSNHLRQQYPENWDKLGLLPYNMGFPYHQQYEMLSNNPGNKGDEKVLSNSYEDVWFNEQQLYLDHLDEIFEKYDTIDDDIWCKVICMERNKRVAKAYIRVPVVTINGSCDEFDGFRIGLCAFQNELRDTHVTNVKSRIAQGVKIKLDKDGSMLAKRISPESEIIVRNFENPRFSCCSPELIRFNGTLEFDRATKIFDMKVFKEKIYAATKLPQLIDYLARLTIVSLSFVETQSNALKTPCWIMLINIAALDVLNELKFLEKFRGIPNGVVGRINRNSGGGLIKEPVQFSKMNMAFDAHPDNRKGNTKIQTRYGDMPYPAIEHGSKPNAQQVKKELRKSMPNILPAAYLSETEDVATYDEMLSEFQHLILGDKKDPDNYLQTRFRNDVINNDIPNSYPQDHLALNGKLEHGSKTSTGVLRRYPNNEYLTNSEGNVNLFDSIGPRLKEARRPNCGPKLNDQTELDEESRMSNLLLDSDLYYDSASNILGDHGDYGNYGGYRQYDRGFNIHARMRNRRYNNLCHNPVGPPYSDNNLFYHPNDYSRRGLDANGAKFEENGWDDFGLHRPALGKMHRISSDPTTIRRAYEDPLENPTQSNEVDLESETDENDEILLPIRSAKRMNLPYPQRFGRRPFTMNPAESPTERHEESSGHYDDLEFSSSRESNEQQVNSQDQLNLFHQWQLDQSNRAKYRHLRNKHHQTADDRNEPTVLHDNATTSKYDHEFAKNQNIHDVSYSSSMASSNSGPFDLGIQDNRQKNVSQLFTGEIPYALEHDMSNGELGKNIKRPLPYNVTNLVMLTKGEGKIPFATQSQMSYDSKQSSSSTNNSLRGGVASDSKLLHVEHLYSNGKIVPKNKSKNSRSLHTEASIVKGTRQERPIPSKQHIYDNSIMYADNMHFPDSEDMIQQFKNHHKNFDYENVQMIHEQINQNRHDSQDANIKNIGHSRPFQGIGRNSLYSSNNSSSATNEYPFSSQTPSSTNSTENTSDKAYSQGNRYYLTEHEKSKIRKRMVPVHGSTASSAISTSTNSGDVNDDSKYKHISGKDAELFEATTRTRQNSHHFLVDNDIFVDEDDEEEY